MKKAFTLVEMLVVVVVLVTLMGISIRLGAIGTDSSRRNTTINRMQRIENALSGYYAAFGTYPPVDVHGSRNVYMPVDGCGLQTDGTPNKNIFNWNNIGDKEELRSWEQVEAACRSQPFGASFPPSKDQEWTEMIRSVSEDLVAYAQANAGSVSEERRQVLTAGFRSPCELVSVLRSQGGNKTDWREIELFKYGVMSYLLPRYYVMCGSEEDFYTDFKQWKGFNVCPRNPYNGNRQTWNNIVSDCRSNEAKDAARILAIPSQAACARWMPNFEGIVDCNLNDYVIFGVNIARKDSDSPNSLDGENLNIKLYRPGGSSASGGDQYWLDSLTILDGWNQEFYYYSEAPFQNYTVWSSGPNKRTFPPWVPKDSLQQSELERVSKWIGDDIIHMVH